MFPELHSFAFLSVSDNNSKDKTCWLFEGKVLKKLILRCGESNSEPEAHWPRTVNYGSSQLFKFLLSPSQHQHTVWPCDRSLEEGKIVRWLAEQQRQDSLLGQVLNKISSVTLAGMQITRFQNQEGETLDNHMYFNL